MGSQGSTLVRAFATHQCGLGSIPGLATGLSIAKLLSATLVDYVINNHKNSYLCLNRVLRKYIATFGTMAATEK